MNHILPDSFGKRRVSALGLGALFALVIAGSGVGCDRGESTPVLRFTAIPDDNTTELVRKYTPLADYLEKALGVEVEYVPSSDYGASVEMFENADVQLAWFGGLTGVQARAAVAGAHAIVQGAEDPNYRSYFIANSSTGLQATSEFPKDIGSFRFTFGSAQSTSGRLMPEYFLRQATGKGPREFFTRGFSFSGSHAQTLALVAAGTVDVGAVNYRTYEAQVANGVIDSSVVRVIWKSPPYPDYNFTAHPDLSRIFGEDFLRRLQEALLALNDAALLDALQRSCLVEAQDDQYRDLARVARQLGLLR